MIGYDLPIGRRTAYFAWIMPEAIHIHLGFAQGVLLADPLGELDGAGQTKRARWLTLKPGDPIPAAVFARFVREAARVAGLSSSERAAIQLDRQARLLPIDTQVSESKPR